MPFNWMEWMFGRPKGTADPASETAGDAAAKADGPKAPESDATAAEATRASDASGATAEAASETAATAAEATAAETATEVTAAETAAETPAQESVADAASAVTAAATEGGETAAEAVETVAQSVEASAAAASDAAQKTVETGATAAQEAVAEATSAVTAAGEQATRAVEETATAAAEAATAAGGVVASAAAQAVDAAASSVQQAATDIETATTEVQETAADATSAFAEGVQASFAAASSVAAGPAEGARLAAAEEEAKATEEAKGTDAVQATAGAEAAADGETAVEPSAAEEASASGTASTDETGTVTEATAGETTASETTVVEELVASAETPAEASGDAAAATADDAPADETPAKARPTLKPEPLTTAGDRSLPERALDLPLTAGDGATSTPAGDAAAEESDGQTQELEVRRAAALAAAGAAAGALAGPAERPNLATQTPERVVDLVSASPSTRSQQNPQERERRMSDAATVLGMIKEKEVEYVDLRFTDPRGKLQHVTMEVDSVDEDLFADGVMFDGSSIAGWKAINESDMVLMPDCGSAQMDPFYAQNTLQIFCDILEPGTGEPYGRDPRSTAKKAMAHLASTGIGDSAFFGPEAEFFVFDDVRFEVSPYRVAYEVDSTEIMANSWTEYEMGNMGHRPRMKGGYFPVNPIDSGQDFRSEMLSTMKKMGVPVEKHHHEVASAQHELGFKFGPLVHAADNLQLYKYCIHNVAAAYGKTATFMPKPVKGDNGTGMHVHQSIWKDGQPLFAGNQYADLSEECLYYIGGILKHAKALNAFTNPSTNSYKRLIPGFEAPVLLAYSARNRSASCRIPYSTSPKGKRMEVRFPDPTANPYLAFTAMMMAGLDGIENKIHPGEPMDKDLYALPPEELQGIPTVCGSLREALSALEADSEFLLKGGVFTMDQLEAYAELKWEELYAYEHTPHPVEFELYYSV